MKHNKPKQIICIMSGLLALLLALLPFQNVRADNVPCSTVVIVFRTGMNGFQCAHQYRLCKGLLGTGTVGLPPANALPYTTYPGFSGSNTTFTVTPNVAMVHQYTWTGFLESATMPLARDYTLNCSTNGPSSVFWTNLCYIGFGPVNTNANDPSQYWCIVNYTNKISTKPRAGWFVVQGSALPNGEILLTDTNSGSLTAPVNSSSCPIKPVDTLSGSPQYFRLR